MNNYITGAVRAQEKHSKKNIKPLKIHDRICLTEREKTENFTLKTSEKVVLLGRNPTYS